MIGMRYFQSLRFFLIISGGILLSACQPGMSSPDVDLAPTRTLNNTEAPGQEMPPTSGPTSAPQPSRTDAPLEGLPGF